MLSHDRRMFASEVNCTRTPAALSPVEPVAGASAASSTTVPRPCSARRNAQAAPTMPAPTTRTSVFVTAAPYSPGPALAGPVYLFPAGGFRYRGLRESGKGGNAHFRLMRWREREQTVGCQAGTASRFLLQSGVAVVRKPVWYACTTGGRAGVELPRHTAILTACRSHPPAGRFRR